MERVIVSNPLVESELRFWSLEAGIQVPIVMSYCSGLLAPLTLEATLPRQLFYPSRPFLYSFRLEEPHCTLSLESVIFLHFFQIFDIFVLSITS